MSVLRLSHVIKYISLHGHNLEVHPGITVISTECCFHSLWTFILLLVYSLQWWNTSR